MVVDVKDISVRYMVGDFRDIGLKEYIIQKLKRNYRVREFWAVNHVTFSLDRGDFLGIIGTNGAGKSTLLKTVSGILRPQLGSYQVNGNLVALLELGTGFDSDLTLRENIYLRGALLGMTEEFMDDACDKILDFAELKQFQYRKYKQLSSGMRSRLAFSISCLVNPDILILDEVLSVGDGTFREKSERKMFEIIQGGATTLFVSHSMTQIKRLSNKVLWLDKGKQMAFGPTNEVLPMYMEFLRERKALLTQQAAKHPKDTVTVPEAAEAAKKPEAKTNAAKPDAKPATKAAAGAAKRPEAKTNVAKPDAKPATKAAAGAAKKPEAKTNAAKPDAKSATKAAAGAAKKPEAKTNAAKPDAKPATKAATGAAKKPEANPAPKGKDISTQKKPSK